MAYRLGVKNTIIMETISGVTSEANILTLFTYHEPRGWRGGAAKAEFCWNQ